MNIILLGPPGSGKGTQARHLVAFCGYEHIATGDLLRGAVADGTPLGREVQALMTAGQLVPDPLMIELIASKLRNLHTRRGFILDGYPRTLPQAQALDRLLIRLGVRIDLVLNFEIDDRLLFGRIAKRVKETAARGETIRADDNEATLRTRLGTYHNTTERLIRFYWGRSLVVSVDAAQSEADVTAFIFDAMSRGRNRPQTGACSRPSETRSLAEV